MAAALVDFLLLCVALSILVGMLFVALPRISPDATFTLIGQWAIGGIAVILLIQSIAAIFGFGGTPPHIDAVGLIGLAIGLIIILIVVFVVYMLIDRFLPGGGVRQVQRPDGTVVNEPVAGGTGLAAAIKYVIGGVALIGILILAEQMLFGGALTASLGGRVPLRH